MRVNSDKDMSSEEKNSEVIHCPYCDASINFNSQNATRVFPYPMINKPGHFLGKINYSLVPQGTKEIEIHCVQCNYNFSVLLFTKPVDNPVYDEEVKNYLKSLSGEMTLEKRVPYFERVLKWYFANYDIFEIKNRLLASYFLIFLPLFIFLIAQLALLGRFSITYQDYPFWVFFILFGLLVYLFHLFIEQYHLSLSANNLPILLSANYRNSSNFKVFEEWKINFFNYAYHKQLFNKIKISHPTFIGLLGALFYLVIEILILPAQSPIVTTGNANQDMLLSIAYLPFWIFFIFIVGYIFVMLLHTSLFLTLLSENTPFEFNPLKKNAGFDPLIKLTSLVLLQISIIGTLFIVLFYDLWRNKVLQIDTTALLNDPWGFLLGFLLIFLLLWPFIVPIITLIKKYQRLKIEYLHQIRNQIETINLNSNSQNEELKTNLLFFKFDKAYSLSDWPLQIQINIIIPVLIPLISYIVAKIIH